MADLKDWAADKPSSGTAKRSAPLKTWAKRHGVSEDMTRRINAAVASAKKQGLHGGRTVDAIERAIGAVPTGNEFAVIEAAKKHHNHAPPMGYGGPDDKTAPDRKQVNEEAKKRAETLLIKANARYLNILHPWQRRQTDSDIRNQMPTDQEKRDARDLADDFEVVADAFEEAGPIFAVRAGTLRKRAKAMREGNFDLMSVLF